jgi:capsule polysaccharide export protein KpsE/RkpR
MSSALLSQLGGSSALASAAGAGLGIKNPGDMYVSLFRSRTIEDALIQRFGLMARYKVKKITDARRAFEDRSTVTLGVKDGLIRITVTDFDPNLAAEIANAYVDEFRKLSANLAITEASQRRIFFQQQLLEANQNLTAAEVALKNTEQSTGVLQPDSQARSLIESGAILRGQVVAKEVELQAMRSYATEDNPQMVVAEQQLTALKAQLAKLGATDENLSSDIIVPKGNIPQAGMEYIRKLRDEKYYETIFELIAKQLEMAKLDEARQGAIVQVADVAVPPDKKSSPQRTLIVVLMTLIAFVIAVLWTLSSEQWHRMQRDPDTYDKVQTLRQLFSKKQRLQA